MGLFGMEYGRGPCGMVFRRMRAHFPSVALENGCSILFAAGTVGMSLPLARRPSARLSSKKEGACAGCDMAAVCRGSHDCQLVLDAWPSGIQPDEACWIAG